MRFDLLLLDFLKTPKSPKGDFYKLQGFKVFSFWERNSFFFEMAFVCWLPLGN
jgi:hypothetical protein